MSKEASKRQRPQKSINDNVENRKKPRIHEKKTKADTKAIKDSRNRNNENSSNMTLILEKLNLALDTIQFLVQEVGDIKSELKEVKGMIQIVDECQVLQRSGESSPRSIGSFNKGSLVPPAELIGPFPKYTATDRVITRPSSKDISDSVGGKAHSLQFTSGLYIRLIEQVLGPPSDTGLDYKAMVKEAILVTKAVVSCTKEANQIDPNLRWSLVDPTIKLDAYRRLETATEHLLPLKTCTEFWGAHVLLSNFWLRRKKTTDMIPKKSSTTDESNINVALKRKKLNAFSIPFLTHP